MAYHLHKMLTIISTLLAIGSFGQDADAPAKASQWGFNAEDATECLQKAINSGQKKIVIDNTGHDWIIAKSVNLASNQELIIADGVNICAKPGCFKERWAPLLIGVNVSNITIRGEGKAVIRMRTNDYQDRKNYEFSEWRHGIFLGGCSNVTIRDFTICDTGGDGIALGDGGKNHACQNIVVDNMLLDNNYRLAMGVVSVDGLILRNSRLVNTRGTPPCSGIDFEPNFAYQRIANVLVENCVFENNTHNGIIMATQNLKADSAPVSMVIRNCHGMGTNANAISLNPISETKGSILVENCNLDNYVNVRNCLDGIFKITFKNVAINIPDRPSDVKSSFTINCTGISEGCKIGGIEFDNVRICDPLRPPLGFNISGKGDIADNPSGKLLFNGKSFDYKPIIAAAQGFAAKLNALKPAACPKLDALRAPEYDSSCNPEGEIPFRKTTTLLQYAEAGKTITLQVKMNRYYHSDGTLEIYRPSGELLSKVPVNCEEPGFHPVAFTAIETGIYQVKCNPNINSIIVNSSARGNGYLIDQDVLTLLKPAGRLYFRIPAGVKEFTLGVAGNPSVNVVLRDGSGNAVLKKQDVGSMELLSASRADAGKDEVWSISFGNAVWLVSLRLYEPLCPILSTRPDTLLIPN